MGIPKYSVSLVAAATLLFLSCDQKATEEILPNDLGGIYLVKLEKNDVAKNRLTGMHHHVDFREYECIIGTYWDGENQTKVYLTIFDNVEKSTEMINAMARNIQASESSEFLYIERLEKDGKTIHVASRERFIHYFYQDGKYNIWITTPKAIGEIVLDDFLKFEAN